MFKYQATKIRGGAMPRSLGSPSLQTLAPLFLPPLA